MPQYMRTGCGWNGTFKVSQTCMTYPEWERCGLAIERRTSNREVSDSNPAMVPCNVMSKTLTTGLADTHEVAAPYRHD